MEGRLLSLIVKFEQQIVKFVCIYAPNNVKERQIFFQSLALHLKGKNPIILGGDFNCVCNTNLDKVGGNIGTGELGSKHLKSACTDLSLIDSFRHTYGDKKEFTWHNHDGSVRVRLYRFYVSKSLYNDVLSINHYYIPQNVSDHSLVYMSTNIDESGTKGIGPGFWKCNVNILKDEYFI